MALKPTATLTFTSYEIVDGVTYMHFVCLDPGPGEPNDYTITVSDEELALNDTNPEFTALVRGKLQRKLRGQGIAQHLDPRIGQNLII